MASSQIKQWSKDDAPTVSIVAGLGAGAQPRQRLRGIKELLGARRRALHPGRALRPVAAMHTTPLKPAWRSDQPQRLTLSAKSLSDWNPELSRASVSVALNKLSIPVAMRCTPLYVATQRTSANHASMASSSTTPKPLVMHKQMAVMWTPYHCLQTSAAFPACFRAMSPLALNCARLQWACPDLAAAYVYTDINVILIAKGLAKVMFSCSADVKRRLTARHQCLGARMLEPNVSMSLPGSVAHARSCPQPRTC